MTFLPVVRIVRQGSLLRDGVEILEASSTVTLIETGGKRIIVDTGARKDAGVLASALEDIGVPAERIDIVLNTHLHSDHCGGNELFVNARFYAHKLESPPLGVIKIVQATKLLPGVEIIPTPGHTSGSISVLVASEKRYAICGDAIPTKGNYTRHVPPFINTDAGLALRSMDLLTSLCDIIIPGHDADFRVLGKK